MQSVTEESNVPAHFAIYGGKVKRISKPELKKEKRGEFKCACWAVACNTGRGFVITPKGEAFAITKESRMAKPVKDAAAVAYALELIKAPGMVPGEQIESALWAAFNAQK